MNDRSILKSFVFFFFFWLSSFILSGQPVGYYLSADGKSGTVLQQALHDIIDNHTELSYSALWTALTRTDKKTDGTVWDMYSDIPGGTPVYIFVFGQDQCGNYSKEGDCYNREHSFPKSWFNDLTPMYTDLHHIVATDGWVNNKRGNYPYGVTGSAEWISTNGSKVGLSSYPGYTGMVFEPINNYKGDFARIILYMAVRYFGEDAGWTGSDMVTGSQPKEWALKMLMEWNTIDPVSQKEKDRNDSVFVIQGNRNPFIDNLTYANLIWGTQSSSDAGLFSLPSVKVFPNPASDVVTIDLYKIGSVKTVISITDISGKLVLRKDFSGNSAIIDVKNYNPGLYIISIKSGNKVYRTKLVVSR
jgi:endonuclease I